MSSFVSTVASGPTSEAPVRRAPRVGPAALLFGGLYLVALLVAEVTSIPKPARIAIALLPIPAFAFFLAEWIRGIRRLDELERRVQLEALAIAFPLSLVLVMALGLIQRVTPLDPADWSYRHVWPFLIGFYFFGLTLARRRYR